MTPPLTASAIAAAKTAGQTAHLVAAARPFIKWAGGKSRLIEQYRPFLPTDFQRYHEPFLGGGALFFHLAPQLQAQGKRAYLSDLNPALVNVYRCVRDRVDALIHQLAFHQQQHSETHYYQVRAAIETEPVAQAARFIYLNKTCYNGLYRENSKGQFNVPIGRYKSPKICVPDLLQAASAALQIADISEQPFTDVAKQAQNAQDFVYFDPPYHPLSDTSKFTAYSRDRFTTEQQTLLKDTIQQLATEGVQILASNSDCPFIRELYADFTIQTITAARSINSKASKRGKITEVLVVSTKHEPTS
ncbi:DNA adenine methylase [cf. Phormidesmis sp. LEGE 11477]|uniref:DNA adenine methylase n=1 Tax=cf. Phormidesmis sp. LEGE 11477 TaxID=1828680 RepID=UPI00187FCAB8|nr:DNA adenine methylase [cf. Phormidesmis sp. LEGE 11477]MBE9064685.1 DNA adenine methylase [cf. Phormidesmis sp. LEGE 11477]